MQNYYILYLNDRLIFYEGNVTKNVEIGFHVLTKYNFLLKIEEIFFIKLKLDKTIDIFFNGFFVILFLFDYIF